MHIISIDPGIEKVGYAILDRNTKNGSQIEYVTSGIIRTNKKENIETRLKIIYQEIIQLLVEFDPDFMVMEQLFFFKNAKTVITVAQAQGVISLASSLCDIPLRYVTPLQIKQAVTGNGTADKKSVEKILRLELGISTIFNDDDESDAVACGMAYLLLNR